MHCLCSFHCSDQVINIQGHKTAAIHTIQSISTPQSDLFNFKQPDAIHSTKLLVCRDMIEILTQRSPPTSYSISLINLNIKATLHSSKTMFLLQLPVFHQQ